MQIGMTGAGGVLGRRILEELKSRGHSVSAYDGDVRDADAVRRWLQGFDAVVHAAALVPVKDVAARPGDAIAVNVAGTANVAVASAQVPGCRLVYLSTSHVYSATSRPLHEDDPTAPSSLYGLTKFQGEAWAKAFDSEALIIRIFSFFDARQQPPYLVPSLRDRISNAARGANMELRGAASVRDIADVAWTAPVCADLVERKASGTINCGTGRGVTVMEIAERLSVALGRPDVTWKPDPDSTIDHLIADVTKLKSAIGELPAFDLTAALSRYARAHSGF